MEGFAALVVAGTAVIPWRRGAPRGNIHCARAGGCLLPHGSTAELLPSIAAGNGEAEKLTPWDKPAFRACKQFSAELFLISKTASDGVSLKKP